MAVAFEGNYSARGSVTLKSADPKDPPLIDPKFLAEPFDRRVAIEAVREGLRFLDSPQIAKDQVRLAAGPEDRSDEAILVCSYSPNLIVYQRTILMDLCVSQNYIRKTAMSMWHCSGTVRMGKVAQPGTCVDNEFRVCGLKKLRVADMSVAPFLLRYVASQEHIQTKRSRNTDRLAPFSSAHTQAAAYLIGETAAEKIIAEYNE